VILAMPLAKFDSRAEGVVRVMHPEIGMGVEFTRATNQQRKHLEKFIHTLKDNQGTQLELVVEPEGMNDTEPMSPKPQIMDETEDPLLELFQNADLTAEAFRSELRQQRNSPPVRTKAAASTAASV
jgi:hypothetical protein